MLGRYMQEAKEFKVILGYKMKLAGLHETLNKGWQGNI